MGRNKQRRMGILLLLLGAIVFNPFWQADSHDNRVPDELSAGESGKPGESGEKMTLEVTRYRFSLLDHELINFSITRAVDQE